MIGRLGRVSLQEEVDLWRLYHMVHYFELCEGKNVKVPRPPKASQRQQRKRVETCITTQVHLYSLRPCACMLYTTRSARVRVLLCFVLLYLASRAPLAILPHACHICISLLQTAHVTEGHSCVMCSRSSYAFHYSFQAGGSDGSTVGLHFSQYQS